MGGGGDGPPQDCYTRMVHATTGGAISGLVGGAIVSNWGESPPKWITAVFRRVARRILGQP